MLTESMPAPEHNPKGWEVEITGLKARVDGFESELKSQGLRQAEGFERIDRTLTQLFSKIDGATNRPAPWGIIVTACVGLAGLGLTGTTALALWANAYFGTAIRSAEARALEAHTRLDRLSERLDGKIERLQEFAWETRSGLPYSPRVRPPQDAGQ